MQPTTKTREASQGARGVLRERVVLGIEQVVPDPKNRRVSEDEEFQGLVDSIRVLGLLQPVHVRRIEGGKYQLMDGERRWRAAHRAGLKQIPGELWPEEAGSETALAELHLNEHRKAPGCVHIARKLRVMKNELALSHEQLAAHCGMPSSKSAASACSRQRRRPRAPGVAMFRPAPSRMLEPRDLEILRALLRLRFLTTGIINRTFFSHERVGRRRLQKLAEAGYIKIHRKGLPCGDPLGAWRLMGRGLDAVARAFPNEPYPMNLVDRLAEGSLRGLWEREFLSQVYFDLVAPCPRSISGAAKASACRLWAREVRRRADAITWQPKHAVVLRYHYLGDPRWVMPDATLTSPGVRRRLFLHVDWKPRRNLWARKSLEAYDHFFGWDGPLDKGFGDGLKPAVLYIVKTESRRASLIRQLRKVPSGRLEWRVAARADAGPWLAKTLLERPEPLDQAA